MTPTRRDRGSGSRFGREREQGACAGHVTADLTTYNLGQNKMEQQTPIPPQIKDEAVRFGRGEGGLGFPFSLSKIVAT